MIKAKTQTTMVNVITVTMIRLVGLIAQQNMTKAEIKAKTQSTMVNVIIAVTRIGLAGLIAQQNTESSDSRQLDCMP